MKKVVIFPNEYKDADYKVTRELIADLKGRGVDVWADISLQGKLDGVSFGKDEIYENADLAISLGGDGTVLMCVSKCAPLGIPVLGVDLGKVGYLASLPSDRLKLLDRVFEGDCRIEERMMLECNVNGEVYYALNDCVVSEKSIISMISVKLYKDGEELLHYRCTGMIFATPTGSTAYNLSAGGSVIDPGLSTIAVTPISQHSLNPRSIIFSPEVNLTLKSECTPDKELYVSIDGVPHRLKGDLTVSAAEFSAKLVTFGEDEFVRTLINKLK